jgi:type IV pilus assembly protein PilA
MFTKLKGQQSGFTLVELMIVVAIIGLLASVAIPNFKQYQAKTKTSEAKLQLAALYSAQTAFAGDYDTYAYCLPTMGFDVSLQQAQRYYAIGFSVLNAGSAAIAVNNGGAGCTDSVANGIGFYRGGKLVGGVAAADATWIPLANVAADGSTFLAAAGGPIDASAPANYAAATANRWTINQNKSLLQASKGY